MIKSKFILLLALFVVAVLALVGAFIWWNINFSPASTESRQVRVVIPRGRGAGQIAQILEDEKVIKSALAFKFYSQLSGKAENIQAGEYTLDPSQNVAQILTDLTSGPDLFWVTVPEGLRREEVPFRFVEGLSLTEAQADTFVQEFLTASEALEGYLFPDSYLVPKDITPSAAVSLMKNTFDTKTAQYNLSETELERTVIIASLIEREAKSAEERPDIAGVIENRLGLGMPLQIDATVQYALANNRCSDTECDWWEPPLRNDLTVNSPYNTYENTGIPPAPIANPGATSLNAAANPAENDYLYYIHDPEGQIYFAKTLDEHNQNVERYLR